MSRIVYRNMTVEDVAQAARIEKQIFSRPWTEENFRDSLELEATIFVVAQLENSGEIVGYCGCYQSFEEGNITNVAVKADVRRQGIACGVIQKVLELGKTRGISTFVLEVRVSNYAAIALYEKMGFRSVGIRKNFYVAPVEDAGIMVLSCENIDGGK